MSPPPSQLHVPRYPPLTTTCATSLCPSQLCAPCRCAPPTCMCHVAVRPSQLHRPHCCPTPSCMCHVAAPLLAVHITLCASHRCPFVDTSATLPPFSQLHRQCCHTSPSYTHHIPAPLVGISATLLCPSWLCLPHYHTPSSCTCHIACYHPSKQPNCSCGTCSGLVTWRTRCTADALSGTRHVVPTLPLLLIAHVTVLLNGGASPMMPALSMTHASVLAPVPFPQLSPHIHSYQPITPSPCALGQQVIVSYCLVAPRVLII